MISRVGPILQSGPVAECVLQALREENAGVEVVDRGTYWRVTSPRRCLLTSAAVERRLGRPFHLPADLELIMASFVGRLTVDEDRALWLADGESP